MAMVLTKASNWRRIRRRTSFRYVSPSSTKSMRRSASPVSLPEGKQQQQPEVNEQAPETTLRELVENSIPDYSTDPAPRYKGPPIGYYIDHNGSWVKATERRITTVIQADEQNDKVTNHECIEDEGGVSLYGYMGDF